MEFNKILQYVEDNKKEYFEKLVKNNNKQYEKLISGKVATALVKSAIVEEKE